jgi:hypothetical protein
MEVWAACLAESSVWTWDVNKGQPSPFTSSALLWGVALIGRIAREDSPAHLSLADIGACLPGVGQPSTLITC